MDQGQKLEKYLSYITPRKQKFLTIYFFEDIATFEFQFELKKFFSLQLTFIGETRKTFAKAKSLFSKAFDGAPHCYTAQKFFGFVSVLTK